MEKDITKITGALYSILDFLPDQDPLKNKAKEKALEIVESLTLLQDGGGWVSLKKLLSVERERAFVKLSNDIEVLESYLAIGKSQGWIDNMNFLIITQQYRHSMRSIEVPKTVSLLEGVLRWHDKEVIETVNTSNANETKGQELVVSKELLIANTELLQKDTPRQQKILEMLAVRPKAQVSDFIKELPNVTKRTVRRDLDDLLKKGKVVRVGEWNQVFYQINR